MRYLKGLSQTFPDPDAEQEFLRMQKKNIMEDFQATVIAIILVTLTVTIEKLIKHDSIELILSSSIIAVLIAIFLARKYFGRSIECLTIIVIAAYNAYRLGYMKVAFLTVGKFNMFFGGYTYAVLQIILVYRVPRFYYKVLVVFLTYLFRFAIVIGFIDPSALQPGLLVRSLVIEGFIVYFFYTKERNQRKIFQEYRENREELLKFKELLADFPQSITVINHKENRSLFINKIFGTTFEDNTLDIEHRNNAETMTVPSNIEVHKPQLGSLRIDQTSIREIDALQTNMGSIDIQSDSLCLQEVIDKLISKNLLKEQTVNLIASHKSLENVRAFQVILKKVIWDKVEAIAVILNDITDQQNIIKLKIADKNKDKYIATVSHEFRTPLHGIIGLLEITEQQTGRAEILKYLSLCKDNAYLLLGQVNSMLAFHQSSTGNLRLKVENINLRHFLEDTIKLFRFQTQEKNLYLRWFVASEVPAHITSDEERLKEVLIHLIGNAIKFTSRGGVKVEVGVDPEDTNCLQFSVTDTGQGINDDDQKNIFQLNWKIHDEESVNKNGVGLGLTVSNALALILNGQTSGRGIQVKSKYNEGSTFSFRIQKVLKINFGPDASGKIQALQNKQASGGMFIRKNESKKSEKHNISLTHSDKSIESATYQEFFCPVDLGSKMSIYVSRNRTNLQELNGQNRQSSSSSYEQVDFYEAQGPIAEKDSRSNVDGTDKVREESYPSSPRKGKEYVFVVDDNSFNLLIAKNLLHDMGYGVKTALGGLEAIEAIKSCYKEGIFIKVILMDCQMPIIDGYETTRTLINMMKKGEIQKIPILAWTANDSQEDVDRCYESGMVGHLTKPTSKQALLKALSKLN